MTSQAKKLAIVVLVLLACVGCDQATKNVARELLQTGTVISYMGDTVRLQYTENKGAFLGLGASLPDDVRYWIFIVAVLLALAVLFGYLVLARRLALLPAIALSLILAGGIGNLIDRVLYDGAVVDFLNLGIGRLRTGIFNGADVAITVGVIVLLFSELFKKSAEHSSSDMKLG